MSNRNPKLLIIDMLESVEKLLSYTTDTNYDTFITNSMMKDAVIRNVQVLGEAANRIPNPIKARYPDVEWSKIVRSRHIVVHEYAVVDYEIIWKIATIHIVPLKTSLEKILIELES